jgi:hypothetical protein
MARIRRGHRSILQSGEIHTTDHQTSKSSENAWSVLIVVATCLAKIKQSELIILP